MKALQAFPNLFGDSKELGAFAGRRQDIELERRTEEPSGRVTVERARILDASLATRVLEAWTWPWRTVVQVGELLVGTIVIAVVLLWRLALIVVQAILTAVVTALIGACWVGFGLFLLWVASRFGAVALGATALLFVSATASLLLGVSRDPE